MSPDTAFQYGADVELPSDFPNVLIFVLERERRGT